MFSIHVSGGGIRNDSSLCSFCRRLFVLLRSWFSSTVIALGWERGHDYRRWRRAAYTSVLELNISSSEQPSSAPLWSQSGCHTFRLPGTRPQCLYYSRRTRMPTQRHTLYTVFMRTLTQQYTHRGSRHESSPSRIDPASTGNSVLHFCPSVFQTLQRKRMDCKIKVVFVKQHTATLFSFLLLISQTIYFLTKTRKKNKQRFLWSLCLSWRIMPETLYLPILA